MEVYLVNKETKEIVETYKAVIQWSYNFVEYKIGGGRCKIYCDEEIEYFTNVNNLEYYNMH